MTKKEEKKQRGIPFNDLYKFEPEDVVLNLESSNYSNLAYVSVNHRDVIIDFYEMPGIKVDDKQVIKGQRISMTHSAAKKLAEVIFDSLLNAQEMDEFEIYNKLKKKVPSKKKVKK